MPHWDEEDLEDMSPRMATSIRATMDERDEVRHRLDHLELVALTYEEDGE